MLTVGVVALPWHHAMTALHGLPFLRELLLYNQWSRFGKGVSGERTGSLTYFVSQLGYGLLPWVAVAIGAGVAALRSKHRFVLLVVIWSVVSHGVVAASATKFHHYILPAVPPLAILCGWHLDQVLRGEAPRVARTATLLFGLPLLALVLIDLVLAQDAPERLFWLSNYDYMMMPGGLPWPADLDVRVPLAVTVTTAAIATGLVVVMRRPQVAVGALLAGALASTIYLLHVVVPAAAQSWSQKALLAHYQRVRSPEDRLFAFWLYFRGETFYSQGATFDPSMKVGDRLMAMPFWPGLGAWRNAHPRVRTYVLVPYYMIATARRNWPELEMVDDTNAHVVLMVLPPR
jgi:hypothetical protein